MTGDLKSEAGSFAARLNRLFQGTVGGPLVFEVVESDPTRCHVGPGPFDVAAGGFVQIPLRRAVDPPDQPERVSLKVEYTVGLDPDESLYLTVLRSTFGLWVRPDPDRRPRPIFRIEYDREAHSKPAAHVHIHAESVELGWLYGTAGTPLPRLSEVHFPVGGRRFRPAVEELLLFLDRERLFNHWARADWRRVVEESLGDWEARQARATVRRDPQAALEELVRLGIIGGDRI